MKKMLVAILMLSLCSAPVFASHIGIFLDEGATSSCYTDVELTTPLTLYVVAQVDPTDATAITAAEFRIDNYLENTGFPVGTISVAWSTDLVICDFVHWGVALAFASARPGPLVTLGTIEILAFDDAYVGADYQMRIMPANFSEKRAIVDEIYEIIDVSGSLFTLNCSNIEYCPCFESVATRDQSFSSIKALY